MADPRKQQTDDFVRTLGEGPGVGQNADGTMNIFPASELAARTAARDSEDRANEYAVRQSEEGYPDELRADYEAALATTTEEE